MTLKVPPAATQPALTDAETPAVTIIIPCRLSEEIYDGLPRLARLLKTIPQSEFEVLVVDSGSSRMYAAKIRELCKQMVHARCLDFPAEGASFSIGAIRDYGVQHARSSVIMFNDIDFLASPNMYRRIAAEIRGRQINLKSFDFFCVPVIWLTQQASTIFAEIIERGNFDHADYAYHSAVLEGDRSIVDVVAYGSSAMVVNKLHYLAIGGHSRNFFGHGAEDYEILHRLASSFPRGPRPSNYYADTKDNSITSYNGFRSYFAVYGLDVFQRGLVLGHLWHPPRIIKGYKQSTRNFGMLPELMKAYDKEGVQPFPLGDLASSERTLFLVDPHSKSASSVRFAVPAMGDVRMIPEGAFSKSDDVCRYVDDENISRVGLLNPYGNQRRQNIYTRIIRNKIPFWIFDRGALPDSWFFDPNGFNADSSSYWNSSWNIDRSENEDAAAISTLDHIRSVEQTLEDNGQRMTAGYWRDRLRLRGKRVIFVPLQRPNDTVVQHFAKACGGMQGFLTWIEKLVESLDPVRWAVVVKKHPLEEEILDIKGAIYAPHDCNIHDLIELSEKVVVINSGVGLLSSISGRPVIHCGEAFYSSPGMAWPATSVEELFQLTISNLRVDERLVSRFVHHLCTNVYSFGLATYTKSRDRDGRPLSLVTEIKFREIRGLSPKPIYLGEAKKGLSLDAPLFFSFGGRQGMLNSKKKDQHGEMPKMPSASSDLLLAKPVARAAGALDAVRETVPPSVKNLSEASKFSGLRTSLQTSNKILNSAVNEFIVMIDNLLGVDIEIPEDCTLQVRFKGKDRRTRGALEVTPPRRVPPGRFTIPIRSMVRVEEANSVELVYVDLVQRPDRSFKTGKDEPCRIEASIGVQKSS